MDNILKLMDEYIKHEKNQELESIKEEIGKYELDCRFAGGSEECEICNNNVFGSIYRIIDKHIKELEKE